MDDPRTQIRKDYCRVFATPDGRKVLRHILTQICGLNAVVQYESELQAVRALERKNVGEVIRNMAEGPTFDPPHNVKVNT